MSEQIPTPPTGITCEDMFFQGILLASQSVAGGFDGSILLPRLSASLSTTVPLIGRSEAEILGGGAAFILGLIIFFLSYGPANLGEGS